MITKTLEQRLNEWCGTQEVDFLSEDCGLSNLFKWAVPQARSKFGVARIQFCYFEDTIQCTLFGGVGAETVISRSDLAKDEAQALALAVMRCVDE